jgi:hypothetical protein
MICYLTMETEPLSCTVGMNTTDNLPVEDLQSAVVASVTESETATQELLAIHGLLERIRQNQTTPKANYTNWRSLRSDG